MAEQQRTIWVVLKTLFDPSGFKEAYDNFNNLRVIASKLDVGMTQAAHGITRVGTSIVKNKFGTIYLSRATNNLSRAMIAARRQSIRPFAGQWLSLMFIGQGVARVFGGMINQVLKITGVFDVWRATLISVLGPVLIPLSQALIRIMVWFMKLDPELKKSIGNFVLFAFVAGQILAMVSPLLILISTLGGFAATWTVIKLAAGVAFKFLGTGLGIFLGIILIVWEAVRALIEIFENWGKNAAKVGRGIVIVLAVIAGIIAIIAGAPVAIVAGIIAIGVALIRLLYYLQPVKDLFAFIGSVAQGIGSFISGRGFAAGYKGIEPAGLQRGGIITRPTIARIGERGPEAVVPLSRGGMTGIGTLNYNPTIQITGAGQGLDIDYLVRRINERLYDDLRRTGVR